MHDRIGSGLQSAAGSALIIAQTVVAGAKKPMAKKSEHKKGKRDDSDARPGRTRQSVWDDAEIVIDIQYTKPGTALDDYLRKEQTRAVLDLLADYVQKRDKNRDPGP